MKRDVGITYLLLILAGCFGFHRFYLERYVSGVLYLLTGGFLGVGVLVDLFLIPEMVEEFNKGK